MFALAGLVGALVATPVAVYASHQFTDVSNANKFHGAISWMADNDITHGCNQAGTKYSPDDFVMRGQLAAFLKRLSDKQVVDAGQVDGMSANEMVRVAFDSTDDADDANGNAVFAFFVVPKDGWLILSGSIDGVGTTGGPFDEYTCSLTVNGARSWTIPTEIRLSTSRVGTTPTTARRTVPPSGCTR
jgi:hypothetical protein